ncbi:BlaR1 family beta-lactam sensor/signal transducer [Peptostreptococcaceae bacterium AGR-M142]
MNISNFISWIIYTSINASFLVVGIFVLKKLIKDKIDSIWGYYLWLLLIIRLIIPYGISKSFNLALVLNKVVKDMFSFSKESMLNRSDFIAKQSNLNDAIDITKDYSVAIDSQIKFLDLDLIFYIWLLGFLFFIVFRIFIKSKYMNYNNCMHNLYNRRIMNVFNSCKEKLNIKTKINLVTNDSVRMPMIYGIFKVYLFLPKQVFNNLEDRDISNIVLHEMIHYKYKDILINNIICLLQIIHWFNPIIYIGFEMMRRDRELACDQRALSYLDESEYHEYGKTMIKLMSFSKYKLEQNYSIGFLNKKIYLAKRLKNILEFKNKAKKNMFFLTVIIFFFANIFLCDGSTHIYNIYNYAAKMPVNYEKQDLSEYFNELNGSFVIYDLNKDSYGVYNDNLCKKRVAPMSTFKIVIALIALEEGVLKDAFEVIPWNHTKYDFKEWNKNHNLKSSMKYSVNWFYEDISSKIGIENMKSYVEKLSYGNKNIIENKNGFWNESSFRISPIEQIYFLKDLYKYKLPFSKENIDSVKESVKLAQNKDAILFGKTGTTIIDDCDVNGWFVGWIEKNDNIYFFATNVEAKDNANGLKAKEITLDILNKKGIYKITR